MVTVPDQVNPPDFGHGASLECHASFRTVWPAIAELLAIVGLPVLVHAAIHLLFPNAGALRWALPVLYGIALICASLVCLRLLLRRGPQLIIGHLGIEDRRQSLGVIEWSDVLHVSLDTIHGAEFLAVDVADPEKYLSRLSWWNRWGAESLVKRGYAPIAIGLGLLDHSAGEVLEFIERRGLALGRGQ